MNFDFDLLDDSSEFVRPAKSKCQELSSVVGGSPRGELPAKKVRLSNTSSFFSCPICNKDISHMTEIRRGLHTNKCLDGVDATTKLNRDKELWTNTIDCPLCKQPLQPGPFRSSHLKRCGKENGVPAERLVQLVEAQRQVSVARKAKGLAHNSFSNDEPALLAKKSEKNSLLPKSCFDEQAQLATAYSLSVSSPATKANWLKSGGCEKQENKTENVEGPISDVTVLRETLRMSVVQGKENDFTDSQSSLTSSAGTNTPAAASSALQSSSVGRAVKLETRSDPTDAWSERLALLEKLAKDYSELLNSIKSPGDVQVSCSAADDVQHCHTAVLAARCPRLLEEVFNGADGCRRLSLSQYDAAAVMALLRFIYSAEYDTTLSAKLKDDLSSLAQKYELMELGKLCVVPVTEKEDATASEVGAFEFSKSSPDEENDVLSSAGESVDAAKDACAAARDDDVAAGSKADADETALAAERKSWEPPSHGNFTSNYLDWSRSLPGQDEKANSVAADSVQMRSRNTEIAENVESENCAVEPSENSGGGVWADWDGGAVFSPQSSQPADFGRVVAESDDDSLDVPPPNSPQPTTTSTPIDKPLVKVIKNNATPYPEYSAMASPQLKTELNRFGLRPLVKKNAVPLLKEIYERRHPVLKRGKLLSSKDASVTVDPLDEPTNRSETSGPAEESSWFRFEDDNGEDAEIISSKTDGGKALTAAIINWMREAEQADLLYHHLMYQPISFEEFHGRLTSSRPNLKFSKAFLMDFMDEQCVTFCVSGNEGGWAGRRQRQQKKMRRFPDNGAAFDQL